MRRSLLDRGRLVLTHGRGCVRLAPRPKRGAVATNLNSGGLADAGDLRRDRVRRLLGRLEHAERVLVGGHAGTRRRNGGMSLAAASSSVTLAFNSTISLSSPTILMSR